MLLVYIFLLFMLFLGACSLLFFNQYIQIFGPVKNNIRTNKKIVALSFDDGPNDPYTSEILELLEKYKAKATFFVVGENAEKFPGTIKQIVKGGHEIGCHGYSHSFAKYILEPTFENEINRCNESLKKLGLKKASLIRTPWLMKNPFVFNGIKNAGYKFIVGGKFSSLLEPLGASSEYIFKSIFKRIKPGDIIIFHDGMESRGGDRSRTVIAVSKTLEFLYVNNYKVVTVSELLEIEKIT